MFANENLFSNRYDIGEKQIHLNISDLFIEMKQFNTFLDLGWSNWNKGNV